MGGERAEDAGNGGRLWGLICSVCRHAPACAGGGGGWVHPYPSHTRKARYFKDLAKCIICADRLHGVRDA